MFLLPKSTRTELSQRQGGEEEDPDFEGDYGDSTAETSSPSSNVVDIVLIIGASILIWFIAIGLTGLLVKCHLSARNNRREPRQEADLGDGADGDYEVRSAPLSWRSYGPRLPSPVHVPNRNSSRYAPGDQEYETSARAGGSLTDKNKEVETKHFHDTTKKTCLGSRPYDPGQYSW
eukprot:GFKZ01015272.1.p1 GENE.GFKZ01015272.1~~GFKZ01015272.1.p1  ORF type:complete len:176 (+),score=8.35 GFKZ01015272.1:425-952(+)